MQDDPDRPDRLDTLSTNDHAALLKLLRAGAAERHVENTGIDARTLAEFLAGRLLTEDSDFFGAVRLSPIGVRCAEALARRRAVAIPGVRPGVVGFMCGASDRT